MMLEVLKPMAVAAGVLGLVAMFLPIARFSARIYHGLFVAVAVLGAAFGALELQKRTVAEQRVVQAREAQAVLDAYKNDYANPGFAAQAISYFETEPGLNPGVVARVKKLCAEEKCASPGADVSPEALNALRGYLGAVAAWR